MTDNDKYRQIVQRTMKLSQVYSDVTMLIYEILSKTEGDKDNIQIIEELTMALEEVKYKLKDIYSKYNITE